MSTEVGNCHDLHLFFFALVCFFGLPPHSAGCPHLFHLLLFSLYSCCRHSGSLSPLFVFLCNQTHLFHLGIIRLSCVPPGCEDWWLWPCQPNHENCTLTFSWPLILSRFMVLILNKNNLFKEFHSGFRVHNSAALVKVTNDIHLAPDHGLDLSC